MRQANIIVAALGLLSTCPADALGQSVGGSAVEDGFGGANAFRGEHQHERRQTQRQHEGSENTFEVAGSVGNGDSGARKSSRARGDIEDAVEGFSGANIKTCSGEGETADSCRDGEEGIPSQHQHQQRQQRQAEKEHDAIAVEIGENDGIRIEFVGKAEGTIPESGLRQAATRPQQQQHLELSSSTASPADPRKQAEGAVPRERPHTDIEVGMGFDLLRCDGESYRKDSIYGGLTVKGVIDHMLSKLYDTLQQTKSAATGKKQENKASTTPEGLAGWNFATRNASWGKALEVATAPLSYLLGTVGSVPGWFSDTVFEVKVEGNVVESDLSQRLLLVQEPPRTLRLVCSMFAPLLATRTGASTTSSPGSDTSKVLPMVRTICQTTSPFPGKDVSRPCRIEAAESKGWVSTIAQKAMSWFSSSPDRNGGINRGGGGDDGFADVISTDVCVCAEGGRGPCKIRAVPSRNPCLYLEGGDISKGSRSERGSGDGRGNVFGPSSTDTSSVVQLRTFPLAVPAATSRALANQEENSAREGLVGRMLATLQGVVVKRALPTSVAVPTFAARLLAGVALLIVAQPLSESRVFHYMLSALLGAVLGALALTLRVLGNPRRALLRMLLVLALFTWLAVAVGDFAPSPTELLSRLPGIMLAFWSNGVVGYPSAGKLFFMISGLVGVIITRWYGLFLDEAGGLRESWCNGQAIIRRVLTLSGLLLLFHGVCDAEIGSVLVMLALSAPSLVHLVRRYFMWTHRSKWYRAGHRLSQIEYEEEGDEYTRKAMAALRLSLVQNNPQIKKLKNQASRKRMSAFARNGEHYQSLDDDDSRRQNCTLM